MCGGQYRRAFLCFGRVLLRATHQTTTATAAALCMIAALCLLTGCRSSDALKEIIYDQESTVIDYENENKYKLSDPSAELVDDTVPASETSENAALTEERQNLVAYSSAPNSPQYVAKQSLWAPNPDFLGLEASSKVNFYETDDPSAPFQDLGKEEEPEEEPEEEEAPDEEGAAEGSGKGSSASADSANKTTDDSDTGGNGNGDEEIAQEEGLKGTVSGDLTGDFVDTPQIGSLAATGDLAVLVQIIGGEGALAAADTELLGSAFVQVFSDEGASLITKGWSGDGTKTGSIDVDAIIKSGAEGVLVTSSSYLSSAEKRKLESNNINIYKVYPMTNSKYIKKDAELIGDMLDGSPCLAKGWDSVDMASQYVDFYTGLLAECVSANGGKLAGTQVYEKKNTAKYSYNAQAKFTLLLDGWDASAKYTAKIDGWTPVSDGVALSTVGYSSSPVDYYIQSAGLIDNAAYKSGTQSGQVIAWQFNGNVASFLKGKWSYASGGLVDKSINVTANIAQGWNMCLFTSYKSTKNASTDNTFTIDGSFGTEIFPTVITATQQIKDKVIANSKNPDGIYHPYDFTSASNGAMTISFFGKYTPNGTSVFSSIGVDSTNTTVNTFSEEGAIAEDSMVVNPHGIFSSWLTGSPEGVLEAAWVNDVVNAESSAVGWKTYVEDFYETFYRYSLSDKELKTIEEGLEK